MAGSGVGTYEGDLSRARELTERGAGTFLDADVQAYMNPYIQGALEPAARELRRETERNVARRGAEAAEAGAFGGSRAALRQSEAERIGTEAMSDLYARGYHSAFESAAQRFEADRQAARVGAEQYRALGAQTQQQLHQDIQALMSTGSYRRQLEQAGLDFDYGQFIEARDWDVTNLQPLLAALSTVPHGYTQTGETTTKSGGLGQVIGLGATIAGAVMGGPAGAALGARVASSLSGDNEPDRISFPDPGQTGYRPTFPQVVLDESSGFMPTQTPVPYANYAYG